MGHSAADDIATINRISASFFTSKGAKIQSKASKTTQILVYGESAGSKLADAQALKAKGVDIEILTEAEFIEKYISV